MGLEYATVAVTCGLSLQCTPSGSDLVLVYEAAEHLFSVDPMLGEVDLGWPGVSLGRRQLPERAVQPGDVVVGQVFGQCPAQVVLIDDQHAVEQLPAASADHPFADGVRSGRPGAAWGGS